MKSAVHPAATTHASRQATTNQRGASVGMGVSAGHGLTYRNVKRLTQIAEIVEYNIGHSIVSRAVFVGLSQAVREMKQLLT